MCSLRICRTCSKIWGSDVALGSVTSGGEELNRFSLKFGGLTQIGFGLEFGILM